VHAPGSDKPSSKRDMKRVVKAKVNEMGTMKFLKKNVPESTLLVIAQSLGLATIPNEKKELVEVIFKQLTMHGLEKFSKKINSKEVKTALHETAENHKPKDGGKEVLTNSGKVPEMEPKRRKSSGRKEKDGNGNGNGNGNISHNSKKHADRTPEKSEKSRPDSGSDHEEVDDCDEEKQKYKETKPIDMHNQNPSPGYPKQSKHSPNKDHKELKDSSKKKVKENSPRHTQH